MKRDEIIGVMVIFIVAVLLFIRMYKNKTSLKSNGVVVIGKLIESTFAGDGGWYHEFNYNFENKQYSYTYNGPIKEYLSIDNLIFLKIDRLNPKNCWIVKNVGVPFCLSYPKNQYSYWKEIPRCSTDVIKVQN